MRRRSRQQQAALLGALFLVLVAGFSTAYAQDCLPGEKCFHRGSQTRQVRGESWLLRQQEHQLLVAAKTVACAGAAAVPSLRRPGRGKKS